RLWRADASEQGTATRASDDLTFIGAHVMPTDTTYATGKRKLAICRAWHQTGSGRITVNGRSIASYFPRATHRTIATYPLEVYNLLDKFNVNATISGGGTSEHAGARRHAIAT